jgi:predicted deacetylase
LKNPHNPLAASYYTTIISIRATQRKDSKKRLVEPDHDALSTLASEPGLVDWLKKEKWVKIRVRKENKGS